MLMNLQKVKLWWNGNERHVITSPFKIRQSKQTIDLCDMFQSIGFIQKTIYEQYKEKDDKQVLA